MQAREGGLGRARQEYPPGSLGRCLRANEIRYARLPCTPTPSLATTPAQGVQGRRDVMTNRSSREMGQNRSVKCSLCACETERTDSRTSSVIGPHQWSGTN